MLFRVLLVDDEPFVREGIKKLINWEDCGFILCGEAGNGEEAVELIESLSPHVIITDIKMPVLDGLELIKRVNIEMEKKIKFVILSGYNEFHFAQTAMRYNVKNYILKPIDEDELSELLKRLYGEITNETRLEKEHALGVDAMANSAVKKIRVKETRKSISKPQSCSKSLGMSPFAISQSNRIITKIGSVV